MVKQSDAAKRRMIWNALSPRNQEILRLFNNGYRQSEIASRFSLSRERVRQLVDKGRRLEIVPPKKPPDKNASNIDTSESSKCHEPRPDNSERNKAIIDLVERGKTYGEIRKLMKLSRSTICSVVYRHEQKLIKQNDQTPPIKLAPKLGRSKTKRLPKYPDVMDFTV